MRKIFCFLLIFMLVFAVFTGCKQNEAPGNAATEGTRTTDNPNAETSPSTPIESPAADFQYEVSQDGKYVYINQYVGTSETVVIPSKIDGLPVISLKGVFENNVLKQGVFEGSNIKSVTIPESVTAIGFCAFKDCAELTQVTVSGNLNRILSNTFRNCVKLESIDFSRTKLKTISTSAFYGCTGLSEIKFSNELTEIEQGAFYDCTALLELDFPDSLEKIGEKTFVNCTSLKTVVIPEKLELFSLSASSFYNVPSLEKIIFKEGRKEIKGYAFFSITSNPEITIPKSVEKFSPYPFFIYGGAKIVFWGNCPEIVEKTDFYGNPTIYYNPSTDGWDTCVWKDQYPLLPTDATSLDLLKSVLQNLTPIKTSDPVRNGQTLGHWLDIDGAEFALVDMNQDGIMEAVVQDLFNVIVIYVDNGSVCGASFTFRSMYNIQKDGSYNWTSTDASGHQYGEDKLDFDAEGVTQTNLWKVENDGEINEKCYLQGEEVTQDELVQYIDGHRSEKVTFIPLNADNIHAAWDAVQSPAISSLPLNAAYAYAVKQYEAHPEVHRDLCKLQPETQQIIEIGGKYYQSYVAANVDMRYIWISQPEFPNQSAASWNWYAVGTANDYSLDQLGKIDEGRKD